MGTFGQQALGALKNAGLNAIGGLPQFAFSMGTSLLNNYLANKSAEKQFNRQLDFWEMQNEYNTPLAQRRRLEQAGFNPALALGDVAGNNTAGNLSSVPGNTYAQSGVFDINALQNSMNAFGVLEQIGADTDLMRSQIELNLIEKIIKNAEAFGIDLDNQQKQKLLNWLDKEKEVSLEKMMAEISNIKSGTGLNEANTHLVNEQAAKVESDRLFTEALTLTENALREPRVAAERAKAAAATAAAEASLAQAAKAYAEGETIKLENQREALRNSAIAFYGFDPTTLPEELAATLMNNFAAVVENNYSDSASRKAMDLAHELLKQYRNKSLWTPTTTTFSWNNSAKIGPVEISSGQGSTISN